MKDVQPVTRLLISRYWHHPDVTVEVSKEKISLSMDIDDFSRALMLELLPRLSYLINQFKEGLTKSLTEDMGSVVFRFSNKKFKADLAGNIAEFEKSLAVPLEKGLRDSVNFILEKIKEETGRQA